MFTFESDRYNTTGNSFFKHILFVFWKLATLETIVISTKVENLAAWQTCRTKLE